MSPYSPNYQGLLARILEERLEKVSRPPRYRGSRMYRCGYGAGRGKLWLSRHRFELEFGAEMKTSGGDGVFWCRRTTV